MADIKQVRLAQTVATRLKKCLLWFERGQRNAAQFPEFPDSPFIDLTIGKARADIHVRSIGSVDVWSGKAGAETSPPGWCSPIDAFNATDQTVTQGKWLGIVGQYIVVCLNPARDVWGTTSGAITTTGTVNVTRYANGDDPGSSITAQIDETGGGATIANGKNVRCLWDDRGQKYWIVSWQC